MRKCLVVAGLATTTLLLAQLSPPANPAESGSGGTVSRPHVVMITVDTLRADHLSSYGYHLKTSPRIDRLASEGVRFDRAHAAIPMTGPSHFSMFTGRYPQEHGARINGVAIPDDSKWLTIPQVLRKFGYSSAAFVSAWPLIGRLTHFDDKFDHFDDDLDRSYQLLHSMRWAEDVTPKAISWLDEYKDDKNIFMWVHYFDPHEPYNLRDDFANPEQLGAPSEAVSRYSKEVAERVRKYDSEIGYADKHIGKLLDRLDDHGLTDNTLVVLVADHGEGLGEHGFVGHGRWLTESVVHVPWIMKLPGTIDAGTTIEQNVSALDLAPTILDLTVPEYRKQSEISVAFAGRSQLKAIREGATPTQRTVRYVSFAGKKGLAPGWLSWMWINNGGLPLKMGKVEGTMKTVWTPGDEKFRVHDLAKDPFEFEPVELTPDDRKYKFEMAAFERWYESTDLEETEAKLSKRDSEILESLGYLQ